jgi:hypothetical protein
MQQIFNARRWMAIPAALMCAVCFHAWAAEPSPSGFDFAYANRGDKAVWPTQVFDSGSETFFQFPPDRTVPAIFAIAPCGSRVLLTPRSKGPYLVIGGIYKSYALQIGSRSGFVDYSGAKEIPLEENVANEPNCQMSAPRATAGRAVYGAARPVKESSIAKPILGDAPPAVVEVRAQTVNQPASKKDAPSGTSSETYAKAVAQAGAKTEPAKTVASTPAPAPEVKAEAPKVEAAAPKPLPMWQTKTSDGTLRNALMRWAADARSTLVWQTPKDFPAVDASFSGDLQTALEGVMRSLEHSEYPLRVCIYDNNVIRVIHKSKLCAE